MCYVSNFFLFNNRRAFGRHLNSRLSDDSVEDRAWLETAYALWSILKTSKVLNQNKNHVLRTASNFIVNRSWKMFPMTYSKVTLSEHSKAFLIPRRNNVETPFVKITN